MSVHIGHIAWNGGRVREGDFVIAAGNDPRQAERESLLSRGQLGDREGATVILVVLPGRFAANADEIAERVEAVLAEGEA